MRVEVGTYTTYSSAHTILSEVEIRENQGWILNKKNFILLL